MNREVVKIVDVVIGTLAPSLPELAGEAISDPSEDERLPICELCIPTLVATAGAEVASDSGFEVVLTCLTVLEAGPQSKPILWTPTSQLLFFALSGNLKVTDLAPPHCVFSTVEPPAEQGARCLHVDPSDMPYKKSSSVSKETDTFMWVIEKDLSEA